MDGIRSIKLEIFHERYNQAVTIYFPLTIMLRKM